MNSPFLFAAQPHLSQDVFCYPSTKRADMVVVVVIVVVIMRRGRRYKVGGHMAEEVAQALVTLSL